VSSCLLGERVRFDGGHRRHAFLTDVLGPHVDWVPFCPEMAIGLGAPRETLRLTAGDHLINRSGTADHTAAMAALPMPAQIDGYVFKAKSPSCGIHGIPRYASGGRATDRRGRGVHAARLMATCPLLPVEDDGRLNDGGPREAFTERIFARARLRELFAGDWRPRDLVAFHTRHTLQLLAHDPARYRRAGRLVAVAGGRPRAEVEAGYRELFCAALAATATRGRHANALLHAFSQVSGPVDDTTRADAAEAIEAYRRGQTPLGLPVALLARHARGDGEGWLAGQTYLAPYPEELRSACEGPGGPRLRGTRPRR
jgi:uncharacterized protein YbgA (DUF1722 family)/uncharacterized protein YbbK (DUF523 family)